jgi:hypothetical protein
MYSRSTMSRWRGPVIRRWSRHSRRSVPMKRSAIAFARGGVSGDSGEVHAATAVLDDDEDEEAAQEDGVDVGRSRLRGWRGPARRGTVARSDRPVGARDRVRRSSGQSRRLRRRRGGRGRPAHLEFFDSPIGDSRGPSAAPGPGSAVRWVVGRVVGAGRSSGGRRAGRASAAAFGARPDASGAAG